MKRILFILFVSIISIKAATAQNMQLGIQYFQDGEYEKAAIIYKELWNKNKSNEQLLHTLTECYIALKDYDKALQVMNEAIQQNPNQLTLRITNAALLTKINKNDEAEKQYAYVLANLPQNPNMLLNVSRSFDRLGKSDYAIQVLEKGEKILNTPGMFATDLANLYLKTGQQDKMLLTYLSMLKQDPSILNYITTTVQRTFREPKEYDGLLKAVFEKVQEDPQNPQLIELLSWIYIQKKDFANALRQLKALDIQTGNNMIKVYNLSMTAYNEGQFETAIQGYNYIMTKGSGSPYFFEAGRYRLKSMVQKSILNTEISEIDQLQIDKEFNDYINAYQETGMTVYATYDYAEFLLIYRKNLDKAIQVLQDLVDRKYANPPVLAELKIRLADYLLIKGERWDASLLYSQVDKDFKEGPLGQEARYKNAKLSYYVGDFGWAQAQFNALKTATSRLISNDAIDQSVFIMDNMGLDSTDEALKLYAATELLIYRNLLTEATEKLDSLLKKFPGHALDDDILYAQAHIFEKQKNYPKAVSTYEKIIADYKEEIRADNALYELAQLYDYQLNDKEKAKELYEKLFNDYSGSVFSFDARQRYRVLRGDENQ